MPVVGRGLLGQGRPGPNDGNPFCQDENASLSLVGAFTRKANVDTHSGSSQKTRLRFLSEGPGEDEAFRRPASQKAALRGSETRPVGNVSQWDIPCERPQGHRQRDHLRADVEASSKGPTAKTVSPCKHVRRGVSFNTRRKTQPRPRQPLTVPPRAPSCRPEPVRHPPVFAHKRTPGYQEDQEG